MPLDTGAVTHNMSVGVQPDAPGEPAEAANERASSVGALLRATRLRTGRSLDAVAEATRIKRNYLQALEEMRIEDLPSRPFTIGFVRSYARALGLDGEAAVERFKQDVPDESEPLRAPVGVRKHADIRIAVLAGVGAIVVSAVLVWNLARHSVVDERPPPPVVPESAAPAVAASAEPSTVAISAAQPAPQESTLPTPYVTPGLDGASSAPAVYDGAIDPKASPTFVHHGAVYGEPANASGVVLQARKSVSIVIRTPDKKVIYAGVLKPGEAYRPPMNGNLSADVSDPQYVDVYIRGQIHTGLTAQITPLAKFVADAQPPATPPAPASAPGAGASAASAAAPASTTAKANATAPKASAGTTSSVPAKATAAAPSNSAAKSTAAAPSGAPAKAPAEPPAAP